jgi:maltose O-acetyltransferase
MPADEPALPGAAGILQRLRDEARDAIAAIEPARLLFAAGALTLPEFHYRSVRTQLLRWAGANVSHGSSILGRVYIVGPRGAVQLLRIGPGCVVGPGVTFGLDAAITIGRNVAISPGASLFTGSHALGFGSRRMSPRVTAKPIVVEDGAWIGMKALVLPGVRLGRGCVISAGAVVTSDVAANTLVAGNPATLVKELALGDR